MQIFVLQCTCICYLADGSELLLSTPVAGNPLAVSSLLAVPRSEAPQQKGCVVLLLSRVNVAAGLTHLGRQLMKLLVDVSR